MEKGFNDYLAKPIVIKDLLSCLKKYLPANLIVPVSSTGEKVSDAALTELTQENKEADEFNEYYLSRYGINIDEGIKFAAGKAGKYKIVLTAYAKFDEPRRHKLIDYIDRKDMDSYAIEVHALKGNARSIGAATLGDIAYEHEKRSKAKDYKYIVNNFGLIRDEMDIVLKGVTELLADNRLLERNTETVAKPAAQAASSVQSSLKQANPILDSDSKGIIINAAKKKKAAEIRTAIEDYDRTLALDEINEWIEQEPLEEVVTFLKEVADNLREFEFEKSLNLLKSKVF
jgi:HPt (histidine-containing phosphotransfer) domain-containing protein